uniref:SRCR domain-containing protein n=1 Tax=Parascaris univalens TaxID=6257 RepID=A0A915AWQ2_PARUN
MFDFVILLAAIISIIVIYDKRCRSRFLKEKKRRFFHVESFCMFSPKSGHYQEFALLTMGTSNCRPKEGIWQPPYLQQMLRKKLHQAHLLVAVSSRVNKPTSVTFRGYFQTNGWQTLWRGDYGERSTNISV